MFFQRRKIMPINEQDLKQKYNKLITQAQQLGHLEKVNLEGQKLLIRVALGDDQAKNKLWDIAKSIDPQYADLHLDTHFDPTLKPTQPVTPPQAAVKTYTVKAGDTLSAIAKQFYGNANDYMKIFNANKDKLKDPNKIQVGQVLNIP